MAKKGFALLEIMVSVIVIGIIATAAVQAFYDAKERAQDDQAKNNLILIQRAEVSYKLDNGNYYPSLGSTITGGYGIDAMNHNLALSLPTDIQRAWNYRVWSNGCARATRLGTWPVGCGASPTRSWFMTIGDADNVPNSGAGCP